MNLRALLALLCVAGSGFAAETRQLAFPTAEGYGRFARGGRGGRVIEVTNLLDYNSAAGAQFAECSIYLATGRIFCGTREASRRQKCGRADSLGLPSGLWPASNSPGTHCLKRIYYAAGIDGLLPRAV